MTKRIETTAAWAAGIFDGEGCVGRYKQSRSANHYVHVVVVQVNREMLVRLKRITGVGNIYGPYRVDAQDRQPIFQFTVIRRADVQHFAAVIWPWLGTVKRRQFRAAGITPKFST